MPQFLGDTYDKHREERGCQKQSPYAFGWCGLELAEGGSASRIHWDPEKLAGVCSAGIKFPDL